MHTFEEPHSILRSESANVSHTMGASFNHENISLPLGASAGKYVSPRPPVMPRPFSQVLFEEPAEQGMKCFGNFKKQNSFCMDHFFIISEALANSSHFW